MHAGDGVIPPEGYMTEFEGICKACNLVSSRLRDTLLSALLR